MKKYFYLLLFLFTVITGFYFFWSWAQLPEGHRFIYPLDDTYIHLALAKNFAEYGVWSINTTGFDSASSSILYTLLLSGLIKVFGNWEYYPLLLNVIFGYLTLYAVYRYFKDFYGEAELKWAVVLLLPFSLLYCMVLIGMEHTMHMFLMVLAVYYIHKITVSDFKKKDFSILLFITFLISITRFESMFFTVSLAFAFFLRKDFLKGSWVLLAGFFAILVFGIISVKSGGYFFPNSVMIKGSYPAGNHFLKSLWLIFEEGILLNTSFYKCLFFPFLILLVHLVQKYRGLTLKYFFKHETLVIVIVATGIMQSLFAFLKYRYENYLMIAVLLLIIPIISGFFKNYKANVKMNLSQFFMLGSSFVVILVSIYRFGYHHLPLKYSSRGINEQQVEMSRFLGEEYKGEKVLANDIGAIAYFSNVELVDIVGLGTTGIARIKVNNKHRSREEYIRENTSYIMNYASQNHCRVAVIYPVWFPGGPPTNWIPVASWKISKKYGPAIERIVFYALTPEEVAPLQQKLMNFDLNNNVEQWFYIKKRK